MTEERQKEIIVGEKRGVPVYAKNPSIPDLGEFKRPKKLKYGDDRRGFMVTGEGEFRGGGAISYEWEEVDQERFVKLYLAGLKQAAGLSKTGVMVFEIVYDALRENPGKDFVMLSAATSGLEERTYQRGLRELLKKEFLYRSPYDGMFFVNIRFMFNGDRLAFVKGYKLKEPEPDQQALPFDDAKSKDDDTQEWLQADV